MGEHTSKTLSDSDIATHHRRTGPNGAAPGTDSDTHAQTHTDSDTGAAPAPASDSDAASDAGPA